MSLVEGSKVRYLPQPEWGVGHLISFQEDGAKALVSFPAREDAPVLVSTKGGALVQHPLPPGEPVVTYKGRLALIVREEPGARGLRRYVLRYVETDEEDELPESEVRALPPRSDLLSTLREGRVGDAKAFTLRKQALVLDDERRCDALGALLASRIMVKPHQVGVVQRVLSARRPRFVLADEVGLGKTIEAGMVFSALRLSGLARRCLVVAPSHLTVQWLVELFHKFNQLFTLMDSDRYEQSLKEAEDVSPWARFPLVVTSLELLQRSAEHRRELASEDTFWDLVIMDEAHHLKGEKAFEAAKVLAGNSWGLLLLTATPMQLDPAEYHGLLTLIDAGTAPTVAGFEERLKRQEELSSAVRALMEGGKPATAVQALAKRFPEDAKLAALKDRDALLQHLAETYSLSDRLVRNRRAVVGGFSTRRLHRHPVELPAEELKVRDAALATLAAGSLRGAPLGNVLRRLESSPAAFAGAVKTNPVFKGKADALRLPTRDAKFVAFLGVLRGIWKSEPAAKVLVFTESRDTLDALQSELGREGVEALGYHGDLPLVERDRQVARFRDPEGPKVLLCTEVGGEGRNFQFAHHLVHYDLPWSPATVEQRIGRLDRIGQTHPVEIHVFDPVGTLASDVLMLLADAVGVFGETVGGLDAVLEEVEDRLAELALMPREARVAYAQELKAKVEAARAQVKRAYDPLLDVRSFDKPAVERLVKRAQERMGIEADEDEDEDGEAPSVEDGLWGVARDLDERLEETVTELGRRVGIGVDTDEQVEAFQVAFQFGHALKVDGLPGLDVMEDRTVLGTFWRDTAVEAEELEYFATGHSLVEALFGFLRDGPYGRSGFRFIEKRGPLKARGLEVLYHVQLPEPEDTSPGARVPSRQLARFLERTLLHVAVVEGAGGPKADTTVLSALETEGRALKGDEVSKAFPGFGPFVDAAVPVAQKAAEADLAKLATRARKAIEAERDAATERLRLSLAHQGLKADAVEAQLDAERAHYERLLKALAGAKVVLDSACGFVINR
ncbi:DEAD/DEAH box helicase family protein [Pyxidicoccus parkwayensis]|uniref:DEAD/DEAH box helicase family protein n=1 Tax=Pyxidicoccus parkwayensis TaxID=2813578 RepID=A0ABX7NQC2_9BACT|nr:helicase-related protein [Pyxidicoccus parkwaysis]QSQ20574.1 DEAD/DEAH box helicase family protein [Pyxidicoccus parkwaysis]